MQHPTRQQTHNLILDYIIRHCTGQTVDAHDIAHGIRKLYGIRVDWHDPSDVLDKMHSHGQITHAGFSRDRMTRYTVI